ncbi:hypothetical protein F4779DRAFT_516168 [Xylariaceae sp. FL0662B]|nr:hypothetical protein F4779DRAFT_516168 [Xylariaceae sp. FL0662B]
MFGVVSQVANTPCSCPFISGLIGHGWRINAQIDMSAALHASRASFIIIIIPLLYIHTYIHTYLPGTPCVLHADLTRLGIHGNLRGKVRWRNHDDHSLAHSRR